MLLLQLLQSYPASCLARAQCCLSSSICDDLCMHCKAWQHPHPHLCRVLLQLLPLLCQLLGQGAVLLLSAGTGVQGLLGGPLQGLVLLLRAGGRSVRGSVTKVMEAVWVGP